MREITLKGQTIQLLAQRAAFWVEEHMLIVADIHLGKASCMQNAGIAVPEGAMKKDLENLYKLINETKAKKCIIVGDLIHAKTGLSERVQEQFSHWLSTLSCSYVPCSLELVLGNHDRALMKSLPQDWNFLIHQEDVKIGPFCFSHIPKKVKGYYVWSGHIHPVFTIKSSFDKITLRCFQITPQQAILPAFSDFVGGALVKKTSTNKIYVIADDQVIQI